MEKSKKISREEFNETQQDRLSVKKGEVKFLTPEEVSKRMKKKYGEISKEKKGK